MSNETMRNFSCAPEVITPIMAKNYLEHNAVNRSINQQYVSFYADEIRKGLWKLNGEPICFDCDGNLVNGQHRLSAVVAANVPVTFLVCRNVEDGSFSTYDSGKKRSVGDIYSIVNIPNATRTAALVRKYDLLRQGLLMSEGNGYVGSTKKGMVLSSSEMVELYNQFQEEFQVFGGYADRLNSKFNIYRSTDIGAVMAFLNINKGYDKSTIFRFFDMLYDFKEHPEFNDGKPMRATTLLRERLIRAQMAHIKVTNSYKQQLLCKAWSAYVQGKDLRTLKVLDGEQIEWI